MSNTKRSYVDKIFENISEMTKPEFNELLMRMEGLAVDESVERDRKSKSCLLSEYGKEIEEHRKNFGKLVGLSSGIQVLDDMTMGLAPGELIIVAGPTSAFKTGLSLNIAANIARQGKQVGFITLEMTKPEIGTRLQIIMGDNKQWLDFFCVNTEDTMPYQAVSRFVKKCVQESGIEILFIDHLHYFARSMDNQATELGLITQEFKRIAMEFKIPVVLISHTRKTDTAGKERNATMNDLRGSSFIAQDADIVLMVNKITKGDGTFDNTKTKLTLDKNRNRYGVPVGTSWELRRDGLKIDGRLTTDELDAWNRNKS